MIEKIATLSISYKDVKIFDNEINKTASLELPDGIKYDPDFLYMKVRAVSAGESYGCNKNADFFPREELKKSYKTFLSAHAFKNHENKDVANAIGDVLSAEWDDAMDGVMLLLRIDRRIAPSIVRGFEKGYMTDVSMGCKIEYSKCSICGNKAKVKSEYCDHIVSMKHKVFQNGDKVFEINIGPKFHDISAVLNGAEKVAKVTGIFISGNKVAYTEGGMQKVASMMDAFSEDDIEGMRKTASRIMNEDIDIPFEKTASKESFLQKIAAIKKEIQGRVEQKASEELLSEGAEEAREILRTVATKYWNREKCISIAMQIKELAAKREVTPSVAFYEFLKVLDFAGIELSPLEIKSLAYETMGFPTVNSLNAPCKAGQADSLVASNPMPAAIAQLLESMKRVIPGMDRLPSLVEGNPIPRLRVIMIKSAPKMTAESPSGLDEDIMSNIVNSLMPDRSIHREFLMRRLLENNLHDSSNQFSPVMALSMNKFSPDSIPALLYSAYQGDRARRLSDGITITGINKFASYIEGDTMENILNETITYKEAAKGGISFGKSLLYGLPLTFGYSALQRSRIKNGENVSGANRYVAENPGSAYAVQALLTPKLSRAAVNVAKKLKDKAYNVSSKVYKKADEEIFDIFKNANIDKKLSEAYNRNQIAILKSASVYRHLPGLSSTANKLLRENNLSCGDIDEYLKTCSDSIKIEMRDDIDKIATMLSEVGGNMVGDAIFAKKKSSLLTALPAAVIDGVALSWLAKKGKTKEKDATKQTKQLK